MKTNWEKYNFEEASRMQWGKVKPAITIGSQSSEAPQPSTLDLSLGCLQRIATALEVISKKEFTNRNQADLAGEIRKLRAAHKRDINKLERAILK